MVIYSIKDMENLSGIKAHTLRIWEKRYDIINPKRTPTNIRYYTDEDLRNLLNVAFLNKQGIKISKIAGMSETEIKKSVSEFTELPLSADDQIETLMLFIFELDSLNVNKVLENYINQIGLEETMSDLIYPLLEKLSMAWLTGSFCGAHESFITQIIRSKILKCTEALASPSKPKAQYLIFLPEGEKQELSMLYMHYLLKKNNYSVINLGQEVSLKDIVAACKIVKPDFVFGIFNNEIKKNEFQSYMDDISSALDSVTLIVTGYQAVTQQINWPDKTVVLKDLLETIDFITS